ncbi:hypothetical protein ACOSQ2_014067 [Xanthoceras sorbifolium]
MQCQMDMRYVLPLIINLCFLFFTPTKNVSPYSSSSWDQENGFNNILQYPILKFLVLAIVVLLTLYISIKISLNIDSIRLQTGDFSAAVAILLLASFIFSLPIFLLVYLVVILVSPWHRMIFKLFRQFFSCFHQTLQSLYTLTIIRVITRQQQNIEPPPAQVVHRHAQVLLQIGDNALIST